MDNSIHNLIHNPWLTSLSSRLGTAKTDPDTDPETDTHTDPLRVTLTSEPYNALGLSILSLPTYQLKPEMNSININRNLSSSIDVPCNQLRLLYAMAISIRNLIHNPWLTSLSFRLGKARTDPDTDPETAKHTDPLPVTRKSELYNVLGPSILSFQKNN
jgi:hypothetical protein